MKSRNNGPLVDIELGFEALGVAVNSPDKIDEPIHPPLLRGVGLRE